MKFKIIYIVLLLLSVVAKTQTKNTLEIQVAGLCDMCKTRIENAALQVSFIDSASWNEETLQLMVSFTNPKFNEEQLHTAINNIGHDTEKSRASDETYQQLHACCKYRDVVDLKPTKENSSSNAEVSGLLMEKTLNKEVVPLVGANVYWVGTAKGVTTNLSGEFSIARIPNNNTLVVSYLGYRNDTVLVRDLSELTITLNRGLEINEVVVEARSKASTYSTIEAIKVQKINQDELVKAACCDLSESFETNPNVDVSVTDAVTGTRTIQMLGLAGPYIQIMRENMPDIRGLAAINGLTYTPGPWVESMQLNLGSGSVVNGFESITGQINVELKKPSNEELFYLNLYANGNDMLEANMHSSAQLTEQLGTAVLLHASSALKAHDDNKDGFTDHPLGDKYIFLNRWKYQNANGLHSQAGIKTTFRNTESGQHKDLIPLQIYDTLWQAAQKTQRIEGWVKTGKTFLARPERSIGLQLSATYQNQEANYYKRLYHAEQKSVYGNLIFKDKLVNEKHQFKTGISFMADLIDETVGLNRYQRDEIIPGAFYQYSYVSDKFTAVGGIRGDYHTNYGFFVTPRFNLRYQLTNNLILRSNMAKGYRTANIFAENLSVFASARELIIHSTLTDTPYGLNQEEAWNMGVNALFNYQLFNNPATWSIDLYRINFVSQVVVDYEQSTQEVHIYSSSNQSYSNSLQTQVDFTPITNLDFRIAYRYNDVKTYYDEIGLLDKALSAKHRAFINIAYETKNQFTFDYTNNWISKKRIPPTTTNPIAYQLEEFSSPYFLSNMQVSKTFPKGLEIYVGGENIFNYTQKHAIIAANDPLSDYFDASLIWGPVNGRNIYAGLRYTFKK